MAAARTAAHPAESTDPPGAGQMADRLPCYWHDDVDGTRYLIPGCMARVQDPDVGDCTCPTLASQIAGLKQALSDAQFANASLQQWHNQVVRAVHNHPDHIAIMHDAAAQA